MLRQVFTAGRREARDAFACADLIGTTRSPFGYGILNGEQISPVKNGA